MSAAVDLDYRKYLGEILASKVRKNPRLSLRSMARYLQISPSSLSEVLSGRKNLSEDRLFELVEKLKLSSKEARYLKALYAFKKSKLQQRKISALEEVNRLRGKKEISDLKLDQFRLISEWHFPVIYELTKANPSMTVAGISKAIGLSITEVRDALGLLICLGLLNEKDRKHEARSQEILVESRESDEGLKKFYRQILMKIEESINTHSPLERLTRTETLAFDPQKLGEVEEVLDECAQRLIQISRSSKNSKEVYHLFTQFFKLTKGKSS